MQISAEAKKRSIRFLEEEKQFHLGMLPTEQSNPKTKGLDIVFKSELAMGVKMLLAVDKDIPPMAEKIFAGQEFALMLEASYKTINTGGKIIFSGCGATGRLSILLESMWRTFFQNLKQENAKLFAKLSHFENTIFSIMTGGDYALIKSVEHFEDYTQFGKRQAQELEINSKDMLIAISEGGETSSVLGSLQHALDMNAKGFLLFNNPADTLCQHIDRSRKVIENPNVTVLDLHCGPMALTGSTRMQATSSEQLVAGALLEKLLILVLQNNLSAEEYALFPDSDLDYAEEMRSIINDLESPESLEVFSEYISLEENTYRDKGLITYFVHDFLIDVFTDTTERAPTFMLAPFKKYDDLKQLPSWAFVKTPLFSTADAWKHYLGRELRCLKWTTDDYLQMDAPQKFITHQPAVGKEEMLKFLIGNETEQHRFESPASAAVSIFSGNEFDEKLLEAGVASTDQFRNKRILIIGAAKSVPENALMLPGAVRLTNLRLMDHMKIKLAMNTISTGTMVRLGKVTNNWMSFVSMSNKKLVDRSIRLISEIGEISYEDACFALHQSIVELEQTNFTGKEEPSPVQYTLAALTR